MKNSRLCSIGQDGASLSTRDLVKEGIDYYTKLFEAKNVTDSPMWFSSLITDEMNDWIARLPLEEEIHRMVCSLAPHKSLGPNGFNDGFFKYFWTLMKFDIVGLV